MACLIAAGVVYTVKGVQSGIQAHKDSKSDQPIAPPTDRYGNPKERHPVYGLVMKAKGKGKGKTIAASEAGANARSGTGLGIDAPAERRLNKEEYESENYGGQSYAAKRDVEPAPPSYEAAIGTPTTSNMAPTGPSANTPRVSPIEAGSRSTTKDIPAYTTDTRGTPLKPTRRDSASSLSSDTSDSGSDSEVEATSASGMSAQSGRRAQKLQRKVHRAEKRLQRASARAERNAERRGERDHDVRKVRRAEGKLERAQQKLAHSV